MSESKVTICIPTYNRVNLIPDLLDSVFNQTHQNFEIIITDNSDNLETQRLIETRFHDKRLKYWKNETNLGMGGNARKAFSHVKSEYFTFTPDDDIWIDRDKLKKQIEILRSRPDVNIAYSNAKSVNYTGHELEEFSSKHNGEAGYEILSAEELLPGKNTEYFLNILTPVLRTEPLLPIFIESFAFESEEYLCFYIAATNSKIAFLYDQTVALREAEHHRTALEDGIIVDWKKRKDIRIRQIFNIYNTLINLHPETRGKLETSCVQNFLARHVMWQGVRSRSPALLLQTILACHLNFRKFSIIDAINIKTDSAKKSFG
jgi:glycosyltransferase involved in cell wall biosynthesis